MSSYNQGTVAASVLNKADKAMINARDFSYPIQILYFIASLIALISLCHFFTLFYMFTTRKRVYDWKQRSAVSLRRVPAAAVDSFRTLVFRWTVPVGSSRELNFAEVGLTLGYIAVLFSWTFVNSMLHFSPPKRIQANLQLNLATTTTGIKVEPHYYANRAGNIAASQLPIMVALGMRNNIISCKFIPLP